jgi:histidine triad (HIT) family protein
VEPCIFCSIAIGEAPCFKVYEDQETVAFLDIGQATVGHTLVVPRHHVADIWSISEDEAARTMRSVHRVAQLLHRRLDPLGINVAQSNGRAAWQEVLHYHVHLIPRYGDDELKPPWRPTAPTSEALEATQARIVAI